MIYCRICGEDIDELGLDNVSPVSGYPVCEDCIDEMMCEDCCGTEGLLYVSEYDTILCKDCLIVRAEKEGRIHSTKSFYTEDWEQICFSDSDNGPVIEYLKERYEMQEVIR
jgi:hypothetical protein